MAKIDKWFSNLRIGKRIFLLFSTGIVFWLLFYCLSAGFMQKMKSAAIASDIEATAQLDGLFSVYIAVTLILSLIFALLLFYLTYITIKSITEPIEMLSKATELISEGIIDGSLSSNRKDEIGMLARGMDNVLAILRSICGDLKDLAERHSVAGDVYAKIDSEKYEGETRESIELLNAMIWQYIADARDVLYCISEFARGNFNTQLRSFPGMRSVANNISNGLRKELVSLTKEIVAAVSCAADGNFEIMMKDSEYKGEWGMLAREINRLLESVSEPIRETTDAMLEIYEGNLNPEIKGEFRGDFALIKTSTANAVESVLANVKEISRRLAELSNGKIETGVDFELDGDFSDVGDALNNLAASVKDIFREIIAAADDMGECSRRLNEVIISVPEREESQNGLSEQVKELFSPFGEDGLSSGSMSKIIELMEDISHQTSLLALSAAVEVARAGENGKGFAFVIEEINNLAERNNFAIEETEKLINSSIDEMKERENRIHSGLEGLLAAAEGEREISTFLNRIKSISEMPEQLSTHSARLRRTAGEYNASGK